MRQREDIKSSKNIRKSVNIFQSTSLNLKKKLSFLFFFSSFTDIHSKLFEIWFIRLTQLLKSLCNYGNILWSAIDGKLS